MTRIVLAVLAILLSAPLCALQVEEMTLLSPITGERFTATGVPVEQPATAGLTDMGADDDGCRHSSGLSEYDFYVITDPYSLFTALSVEWDARDGRFTAPLSDEFKGWVGRDLNGELVAGRERAFKSAQAMARAQGREPPARQGFVMPQAALSIDQRYLLARRCYERRGALPSVLAKISLTGGWALRCRLNVPIADPRLSGGYAEVNELVARNIKDGESFQLAKWLPVYRELAARSGFTDEGFFVANATYLGLVLRDGDLSEARRVLQAMDDRFQRIESKDLGQFLRSLQRERKVVLDRYVELEAYAANAFMRGIDAGEFTRARLPQYVLAVAECLRRSGNAARSLAWYSCLARMAETQPRLREDIRTQGRAPGAEAPFHVHLGWIADVRLAAQLAVLAANGEDPSGQQRAAAVVAGADPIEGPDRRLLAAILFEGLGTAAYQEPGWKPRVDGDWQDSQRMLTLVGQAVMDYHFRLGGWPQDLGQIWEREVLKDRNRVNRFHCPQTGKPLLYRPLGIALESLTPRTVLIASPAAVKTPQGPRYGAFLAGNSVAWSERPVQPGDELPR